MRKYHTALIATDYAVFKYTSPYNDAIYSIGGWLYGTDTSKDLSNVQHYDAVNSKWIKDTSLNTARNAAAAVVYKDKLYVLGGSAVQSNYTNIPISNLEAYPLK